MASAFQAEMRSVRVRHGALKSKHKGDYDYEETNMEHRIYYLICGGSSAVRAVAL